MLFYTLFLINLHCYNIRLAVGVWGWKPHTPGGAEEKITKWICSSLEDKNIYVRFSAHERYVPQKQSTLKY